MNSKENHAALGRLALRETGSVAGPALGTTDATDREAAIRRIIADLSAPILSAKYVLARLTKHLQDSDLTINFIAYKFFNSAPKGVGYVSQFAGGNKWGDGSYITMRDEAEEAMFDYSGAKPKPSSVPKQVLDRIKQFGKLSEPTFEPSMRPKYAALNYARLDYGSAGQWGESHMVLKEHVKHIATYVHTDSFDEAGSAGQRAALPGKVANYINMDRLIANMPLNMLKALDGASNGKRLGNVKQVPGLGGTSYIEAHVHGEIRFDRDIAKIVLSNNEIAQAQAKTLTLKQQNKPFKVRTAQELEKIFTKFAQMHGIAIVRV